MLPYLFVKYFFCLVFMNKKLKIVINKQIALF